LSLASRSYREGRDNELNDHDFTKLTTVYAIHDSFHSIEPDQPSKHRQKARIRTFFLCRHRMLLYRPDQCFQLQQAPTLGRQRNWLCYCSCSSSTSRRPALTTTSVKHHCNITVDSYGQRACLAQWKSPNLQATS